MVEQRSRLQLLDELRRLDRAHAEATLSGRAAVGAVLADLDDIFERYSYGELQIIADYLSSDIDRLLGARSDAADLSR